MKRIKKLVHNLFFVFLLFVTMVFSETLYICLAREYWVASSLTLNCGDKSFKIPIEYTDRNFCNISGNIHNLEPGRAF